MPLSFEFAALLAALDGDLRPQTMATALNDDRCARILACLSGLPPWVRALGAASAEVQPLIPSYAADEADARMHMIAVLDSLSDKQRVRRIMSRLSGAFPSGSLADHARTLSLWVDRAYCEADSAAALIGASRRTAKMLQQPSSAAFAIRRWGESASSPTAWCDLAGSDETRRLVNLLRSDRYWFVWNFAFLPDPLKHLDELAQSGQLSEALNACLSAPQQTHMDPIIDAILNCTDDLLHHVRAATLVRLAHRRPNIVSWLTSRLKQFPHEVKDVCAIVRWDDLPDAVQDAIRANSAQNSLCQAIRFARDEQPWEEAWDSDHAQVFFAMLDPAIWERLSPHERMAWMRLFWHGNVLRLACRSLGIRSELLHRVAPWLFHEAAAGLCARGMLQEDVCVALLPVAFRFFDLSQLLILLPHLETHIVAPEFFTQVVVTNWRHFPDMFPDKAAALVRDLGIRAAVAFCLPPPPDALHAALLPLSRIPADLSPTVRTLMLQTISSALIAPDGMQSISTLDAPFFVLLTYALRARHMFDSETVRSASNHILAMTTLAYPSIADLLAPAVRVEVAAAGTAILAQMVREESDISGLKRSLTLMGTRAPRETLALLMALDRLKDHPGDAQARQTLAAQQGRLHWIADLLAPDLRAAIAATFDPHCAARDAARRLR